MDRDTIIAKLKASEPEFRRLGEFFTRSDAMEAREGVLPMLLAGDTA